jgi:hypothetical protein
MLVKEHYGAVKPGQPSLQIKLPAAAKAMRFCELIDSAEGIQTGPPGRRFRTRQSARIRPHRRRMQGSWCRVGDLALFVKVSVFHPPYAA